MGGLAPNSVFVVIRDVITYFKFGDNRFRGLVSTECQILPFSIDFDGRPYNSQNTVRACDERSCGRSEINSIKSYHRA